MMPAVSENQRITAAIAKYHPEKLYKRNRGMLSMTEEELHEYASSVKKKPKSLGAKARERFKKRK